MQDLCSTDLPSGNMPETMKVIRLRAGDMSLVILIRDLSAMKDLDHQAGIDDLSEIWKDAGGRYAEQG